MALRIQVFVQVALMFCVVTTSMGGITDLHKTVSELENKVKVSQDEIKSLHLLIKQLEKRLQPLEAKGEFGGLKCDLWSLFFMAVSLSILFPFTAFEKSISYY